MLSNKWYNRMKWFTAPFLPAVGALYFALAQIWDFERTPGVNATISALGAFLGTILGLSTRQYNKTANVPDGDLYVAEDPVDGAQYFKVELNEPPESLVVKDKVTFQVQKPVPPE